MKNRLLTFISVLAAAASLPAREFTDLQGRKIDAEIVSATPEQVTLKMTGSTRVVTARVDIFSADDQKFIRDYAAANMKFSFEVRFEKKKKGSTPVKQGGMQGVVEDWCYNISLRNISNQDAEGLVVMYSLYAKEVAETGRMGARVATTGKESIEKIAKNATGLFETGTVPIARVRPAPGYRFTSGESNKSDQMAGFALVVMKDGKEVYSYATEPSYMVSGAVSPP